MHVSLKLILNFLPRWGSDLRVSRQAEAAPYLLLWPHSECVREQAHSGRSTAGMKRLITSNHSCLLNCRTRVRTRDASRDKWPYTHCTLCICSHTSESTLRWRRCVRLVSTKCLGMIRSVCVWCYIFLYIYTSRNLMLYLHFGSNEEQLRCVRHCSAQLFCILLDAAKSLLCNNTTYASRKHHSASEPFVTPSARVWPDLALMNCTWSWYYLL